MRKATKAFTLIEILVVVVILGILASIVVPQFASATADSQKVAIADQVAKLRRIIAVYYVRNGNTWPNVEAGDGTWGALLERVDGASSAYMRQPPANVWIGGAGAKSIILRGSPDTAYQTDYGWIFDPVTGNVWAGGCDGSDNPLPRP